MILFLRLFLSFLQALGTRDSFITRGLFATCSAASDTEQGGELGSCAGVALWDECSACISAWAAAVTPRLGAVCLPPPASRRLASQSMLTHAALRYVAGAGATPARVAGLALLMSRSSTEEMLRLVFNSYLAERGRPVDGTGALGPQELQAVLQVGARCALLCPAVPCAAVCLRAPGPVEGSGGGAPGEAALRCRRLQKLQGARIETLSLTPHRPATAHRPLRSW